MSYTGRIAHLQEEHTQLDKQIDALEKNELFDDIQIVDLKKQRLHLRDEIARLTVLQQTTGHA